MSMYVDRASWGARPPKTTPVRMHADRVSTTYIHHGASPVTSSLEASKKTVRAYQNFHMDSRGWNDIAYSFLVDNLGNVFEGRGWFVVGGHTQGQNSVSHAICWIGNGEPVSEAALASIAQLISEAESRVGHALLVKPHSAAPGANTTCPGDNLRKWLNDGRPLSGAPSAPAQPVDDGVAYVKHVQERLNAHSVNDSRLKVTVDGVYGPKSVAAVKQFQSDVHLPVTGAVGPQDIAALDQAPAVPHTSPPLLARPLLRRGSSGAHVDYLQERLNAAGSHLKVDGQFGPGTEAAVRGFQKSHHLTVDGLVGPSTWKALG